MLLVNRHLNRRIVFRILALAGAVFLSLNLTLASAQTINLTGRYGCVGNNNVTPYLGTYSGQNGVYINNMSIINFDTGRASAVEMVVDNFNVAGASQRRDVVTDTTFTVTAGPFPGSYTVTFTAGGIETFIPVNSGNTILSASARVGLGTLPGTSVCQKI